MATKHIANKRAQCQHLLRLFLDELCSVYTHFDPWKRRNKSGDFGFDLEAILKMLGNGLNSSWEAETLGQCPSSLCTWIGTWIVAMSSRKNWIPDDPEITCLGLQEEDDGSWYVEYGTDDTWDGIAGYYMVEGNKYTEVYRTAVLVYEALEYGAESTDKNDAHYEVI
jgi:hypothetical protein